MRGGQTRSTQAKQHSPRLEVLGRIPATRAPDARVLLRDRGPVASDVCASDAPQNPAPPADLSGKVQELHDTLGRLRQDAEDSIERVRQESEDKIERLKRESDDATKTIAKLQMQLEQQSDYDLLKREVQ